jgi:hypothetical protein
MSFRLLVGAPFPEDGTSIYRAWGPIPELRKSIPDLEIESFHTISSNASPSPRIAWPEMQNIDAVMLQRPFTHDMVQMAHITKKHKKPLWIDYDDDLQSVPEDNPTHWMYNTPEVRQNVEAISRMADIITVSTKFLGEKIAKFNPKVLVVPNALNMRWLTPMDSAIPRNKCVMWRGSHCHFADLDEYTEQILAAYREFPDWSWVFLGYNPTWITKHMDRKSRARIIPFTNDYIDFIQNMQNLRCAVQIIPLVHQDFNFAKSRVAHIEASLAGSAVLAPDWEEWQDGHIYRYSGKQDFQEKLFHMLKTPLEELAEVNKKDWIWVNENRTLGKVNEFRRAILEAFRRGTPQGAI